MELTKNQNIGELVATDYRTAQVFKNHNIDFCCHGNRSIEEASSEKNLDPETLLKEIREIRETNDNGTDFRSWPLDLLADYVEKKHHRYVEKQIPVLKEYLAKINQVHGQKHPELEDIQTLFNETSGELSAHMKKEELILFPLIRKLAVNTSENKNIEKKPSVSAPIQKMMEEHDSEGVRFQKIHELSGNYAPPADACNTYRTTFSLLKEFENDLHEHIHLENNILFPGAIGLEKERLN